MGSHSYLVNLETNIHDLQTSGLLNSHASATTTTNVGHLAGDRSSVISLSELISYDLCISGQSLTCNEKMACNPSLKMICPPEMEREHMNESNKAKLAKIIELENKLREVYQHQKMN